MKKTKILSIVSVLLIAMFLLLGNTALAANVEGLAPVTTNGTSSGSTINAATIKKSVHTNDTANIPTYTYTFTAKSVTGNPDGGTVKNTVANMPAITAVSTTTAGWAKDSTIADSKYAYNESQTLNVAATFGEVGVYTYTVTETNSETSETKTFDMVFDVAKNSDENALIINAFTQENTTAKTKDDDHDDYLSSKQDAYIEKLVTGQLGDTTKEFTFTISVTDVLGGESVSYKKQETTDGTTWSDCTGTGATGTISLTKASGETSSTGSATVTLKNNQRIVLEDLEVNSTYSATETAVDGYTTNIDFVNSAVTDKTNSVATGDVKVYSSDNGVIFTNTKPYSAQTGVIIKSLPYVGVIAIAIIGIVAISVNKAKKSKE